MRKAAIALGFLYCGAAQAGIVNHGFYTEDLDTGLYWLDLTETFGQTIEEVQAEMDPGGRYEGWSYATRDDMETFLPHVGFPPQRNPCEYTGNRYCDTWSNNEYQNKTTQFINFLGDTWSLYQASISYSHVPDPAVTNGSEGYLWPKESTPVLAHTGSVFDWENLNVVFSGGNTEPVYAHSDMMRKGSYLIRNTLPTPLPPKVAPPAGAINFETIEPDDLGVQFLCDGAGGGEGLTGECSGHFMSENATGAVMWLGIPSEFDRQATPWMRITGFDYLPIPWERLGVESSCSALDLMYIDDDTGRNYIQAAGWAPQGGGWCRAVFDTEWVFLPPLPGDVQVPGVAPVMAIGSEDVPVWSYDFFGWGLDNLIVETIDENVVIDFEPWIPGNTIKPKSDYAIAIEVKTTAVLAGDDHDFDATQIDASTLSVGPGGAPNIAAFPQEVDFDNDGDTDMVYAFDMQATGLDCLDTSITIVGFTLGGVPFAGSDVTVPIECEEPIEIDVDPYSAANEIRPEDDYTVPVALLSKSIATGDDADLDVLQIDPASLGFGPALAPNVAVPVTGDLNGDTLTDIIYGFNVPASGIACNDTSLDFAGETYPGLPVIGSDTITPVDCTGAQCHP